MKEEKVFSVHSQAASVIDFQMYYAIEALTNDHC